MEKHYKAFEKPIRVLFFSMINIDLKRMTLTTMYLKDFALMIEMSLKTLNNILKW